MKQQIKNGIIFGLTAGIVFTLFGVVYAAWNDTVSNGDTVSASSWNTLVGKVEDMDNAVSFSGSSIQVEEICDETGVNCQDISSGRNGTTMVNGWADAIVCESGTDRRILIQETNKAPSGGTVSYWTSGSSLASANYGVIYNSNKTLSVAYRMAGYDCNTQDYTTLNTAGQTFNFVGGSSSSGGSASTMVNSWPDAIFCSNTGDPDNRLYYYPSNSTAGGSTYTYARIGPTSSTQRVTFNSNGTWNSSNGLSASWDCFSGSWSVSDFYSNSQAFNFVGE